MKRKNQHPHAGGDQRARTRHQVAQAKPLGREANPANGAEPRHQPGNVKPAQRRAVAGIDEPSRASAQKADIGARMRDAQHGRRAIPKAAIVVCAEIRSAVGTKIPVRDGAEVEAVAEFLQHREGLLAESVAPGKIGIRAMAEAVLDAACQLAQLRALERHRQIAWVGVVGGNCLDKGRVHPGVKMRADRRPAVACGGAQRRDRRCVRGDRVVDHIDGANAVPVKDLLKPPEFAQMRDAFAVPVKGFRPVELLLRVHNRQQYGASIAPEIDRMLRWVHVTGLAKTSKIWARNTATPRSISPKVRSN